MTNKTPILPKLNFHPTSRQNVRSPFFAPAIQPRLSVNPQNDVYEQEADAMAEKIVRDPHHENIFFPPATNSIQRKCAQCEEEEKKDVNCARITNPTTTNEID